MEYSSSSEDFEKSIFVVDSKELATYLTTVQKMYTMGESRENVFEYFLKSMTTLMSCDYGFVAELIMKDGSDDDTDVFRTLAVKGINKKRKTDDFINNDVAQYDIPTSHDLFTDVFEQRPYTLKEKELKSNTLFGWHKLKGMLIVPFLEKQIVTGVIVLASNKKCLWESDEKFNRILPIKYICASLLKGFRTQSLKEIYENIVNYISLPILVFTKDSVNNWVSKDCDEQKHKKPVKSFSEIDINHFSLSFFNCIVCNDAFEELSNGQHIHKSNLIGKYFYDCFPNMIDNSQIQKRWLDMWKTGEKTSIDAINFYDKYVKENLYSIEFNKLDQRTFMIIMSPVCDQLRAKELIEDVAKSQEEFVAKISHELRTPVHAILSIVSLLYDTQFAKQSGEAADDFRKKLQMMSESSVTLCSLIQDILDYTQLESKSLKVSYTTFDLSECIDNALTMVSSESRRKGLSILKFISNSVPLCLVSDPKRLKQILVNLLSNAVKFTNSGSIELSVSTKNPRSSNNLCLIQFAIKDTGVGISSNDKKNLFKPFSQVGNSDEGGTGLGLVISKHLANLLGGDIWVESKVGRGSTFYFTIKTRMCGFESVQEFYGPILKEKHILLIDDNTKSRNQIVSYLIDHQIKTTSVEDGNLAIKYLQANNIYNFDLIIVDSKYVEQVKKYHDQIITIIDSESDSEESDISTSGRYGITISDNSITDDDMTACNYVRRPVDKVQLLQLCYSCLAKLNIKAQLFKFPSIKKNKRTIKILMVEDDYINRQVLKEILEKLSYKDVDEAEHGEQALKCIKKQQYDIILLDLKMPVMNGYRFYELLKEHYEHDPNKMPHVVALTASAMNSDKQKCLNMGMDDYLPKPINIGNLRQILDNI